MVHAVATLITWAQPSIGGAKALPGLPLATPLARQCIDFMGPSKRKVQVKSNATTSGNILVTHIKKFEKICLQHNQHNFPAIEHITKNLTSELSSFSHSESIISCENHIPLMNTSLLTLALILLQEIQEHHLHNECFKQSP